MTEAKFQSSFYLTENTPLAKYFQKSYLKVAPLFGFFQKLEKFEIRLEARLRPPPGNKVFSKLVRNNGNRSCFTIWPISTLFFPLSKNVKIS